MARTAAGMSKQSARVSPLPRDERTRVIHAGRFIQPPSSSARPKRLSHSQGPHLLVVLSDPHVRRPLEHADLRLAGAGQAHAARSRRSRRRAGARVPARRCCRCGCSRPRSACRWLRLAAAGRAGRGGPQALRNLRRSGAQLAPLLRCEGDALLAGLQFASGRAAQQREEGEPQQGARPVQRHGRLRRRLHDSRQVREKRKRKAHQHLPILAVELPNVEPKPPCKGDRRSVWHGHGHGLTQGSRLDAHSPPLPAGRRCRSQCPTSPSSPSLPGAAVPEPTPTPTFEAADRGALVAAQVHPYRLVTRLQPRRQRRHLRRQRGPRPHLQRRALAAGLRGGVRAGAGGVEHEWRVAQEQPRWRRGHTGPAATAQPPAPPSSPSPPFPTTVELTSSLPSFS